MPCNLSNNDCAQSWASLPNPNSPADFQAWLAISNFERDSDLYQNNIQNWDTGSFDDASQITFNLSPWMCVLEKLYRISGNTNFLRQAEDLIDQLWNSNDASLIASGYTFPDCSGNNTTLMPGGSYPPGSVPWGFENQPWRGWSRYACGFVGGNPNGVVTRAEVLTDGIILKNMMCVIRTMKECEPGLISTAKMNTWLNDINFIISAYDGQFAPPGVNAIFDADNCDGMGPMMNLVGHYYNQNVFSPVTGQYSEVIPLNQISALIGADVLLGKCLPARAATANAHAAAFVQDINNWYFDQNDAWYYAVRCNICQEQYDDLGHGAITMAGLKCMAECGVAGAEATLARMAASVKQNAYLGNGDWAFYNDGDLTHATTSNVGQPINPHPIPGCSGTYRPGESGNINDEVMILLADMPASINCQAELTATWNRFRADGGNTGNGARAETMLAAACFLADQCRDEIEEPEDACLSCEGINATTFEAGTAHTVVIPLLDENGAALTQTPVLAPTTYIQNVVNLGGGSWQVTYFVPAGQAGSYSVNISVPGICSSCNQMLLVNEPDVTEPEPPVVDNCSAGQVLASVVGGGQGEICFDPNDPNATVCIDVDESDSNRIIRRNQYSAKTCNQVCCTDGGLDTVLMWCNWCAMVGATIEATGMVGDTTPQMACECEDGVFFQFLNRTTYSVTLTEADSFDSVVLSGHDLCKVGATVKIFVDGVQCQLMSHTDSEAIIEVEKPNKHGIECGCKDTAMYLPACKVGTRVDIEIESTGIRSINNVFIGQSYEIDLEEGAQDAWWPSPYEAEVKTSTCGFLPRSLKQTTVDVDIELSDLDSEIVDEELKEIVTKYGAHYPIHYALSRTTRPECVARAVVRISDIDPATFGNNPCRKNISIPLTLHINGC